MAHDPDEDVTEDMKIAGANVLASRDDEDGWPGDGEVAAEIYRAMRAARKAEQE